MRLLEEVSLPSGSVRGLSILAGLTGLKDLKLTTCELSDLSPLFPLAALERLDMRFNAALTLESVAIMRKSLQTLRFAGITTGWVA